MKTVKRIFLVVACLFLSVVIINCGGGGGGGSSSGGDGNSSGSNPPAVDNPVTCVYTYSDWAPLECPESGIQTRTVISVTPDDCVGTPDLTQECTYVSKWKLSEGDPFHVAMDATGNVAVSGMSNWQTIMAFFHADGSLAWEKKLPASGGMDNATGVAFSPGGDVIISRFDDLFGDAMGRKEFVEAYNSNNGQLWSTEVPSCDTTGYGPGIAVAPDGSIYKISIGCITKLNSGGSVIWTKNVGELEAVAVSGAGVFIVGVNGRFQFLAGYDAQGNDLFPMRQWGDGVNFRHGGSVCTDSAGVYVGGGGSTADLLGTLAANIRRYDFSGNLVGEVYLSGLTTKSAIACDGNGQAYFVNNYGQISLVRVQILPGGENNISIIDDNIPAVVASHDAIALGNNNIFLIEEGGMLIYNR